MIFRVWWGTKNNERKRDILHRGEFCNKSSYINRFKQKLKQASCCTRHLQVHRTIGLAIIIIKKSKEKLTDIVHIFISVGDPHLGLMDPDPIFLLKFFA